LRYLWQSVGWQPTDPLAQRKEQIQPNPYKKNAKRNILLINNININIYIGGSLLLTDGIILDCSSN
jgi:hypothetical protein